MTKNSFLAEVAFNELTKFIKRDNTEVTVPFCFFRIAVLKNLDHVFICNKSIFLIIIKLFGI